MCGVGRAASLSPFLSPPLELVRDSVCGSTAMPRRQRLKLGKLLSEQIAMLELLVEDLRFKIGAVPEAFMANLAELQLCAIP